VVDQEAIAHDTDYPYADTYGDSVAELRVDRISSENAQELIKPIRSSLDVLLGRFQSSCSHALLVSGTERNCHRRLYSLDIHLHLWSRGSLWHSLTYLSW
jgi:hypothetical protein